ncbi:hypothetical protein RFI_12987 [Reticulomyxa filosa]|uniref:Uncharacterized protein n=1 Tax=Reticulomyxa filosa TaxID=46433 RepID=X6NEI5_RETFI|nr:hypothetical protein RFI_12987 [Reticulomyxa filosa]|eukprot:ETO24174.1 hypothetical protein RFI_12987 [Reticulomyxa filosa]
MSFNEISFDKPLDGPEQQVESATFYITGSQSRITKYGKFTNLKKIQVVGKVMDCNTFEKQNNSKKKGCDKHSLCNIFLTDTLRGDLAKIKIGYYTIVGEGTILKPSEKSGEAVYVMIYFLFSAFSKQIKIIDKQIIFFFGRRDKRLG